MPRMPRAVDARLIAGLLLAAVSMLVPGRGWADDALEAKQLVEKATMTLEGFAADPNMEPFRDTLKRANGVLVMPQVLRAAFVIGASGGIGVLIARDEKAGQWNGPAFYTLVQASFGFQAGADAAEVVILAMTERGVTSLLNTSVKFGGDLSVALGPVGGGVSGATANVSADLVAYSKAKGLYGGFSIDGGVVGVRGSWNQAYYGQVVTPTDILIERAVTNPHAEGLIRAVEKMIGQK